jgi:hypothetical protein
MQTPELEPVEKWSDEGLHMMSLMIRSELDRREKVRRDNGLPDPALDFARIFVKPQPAAARAA